MKKIPTLFKRDENEKWKVLNEVNPDCQWVIDGEGTPTEKFDGTCCLLKDEKLYRRRELDLHKMSYEEAVKTIGFICADPDDLLNLSEREELLGWQPVSDTDPNDKMHREGLKNLLCGVIDGIMKIPDDTYELVGPLQKNYYHLDRYKLWLHGSHILPDSPRDFDSLKTLFQTLVEAEGYCEGIVWHHPDGRMAKLKVSDFFGKKCQLHKQGK